jgi:organic radical activating enzyme
MNAYPEEERINFAYEQIVNDIDRFFSAVDSIAVVSVIGGEPFLHPDINKIVKHILTKNNFGVINITTNGICKLTSETLDGFDNERVKISFSKYVDCLSPAHKALFEKNVRLVAASNVIHSVGVPIWNTPSDLTDKCHPVETMMAMKAHCEGIRMCMNVKNGRFFPCSKTEPLHCLKLVDYQNDYIDFSTVSSPRELRGKIRQLLDMPYFQSCSHCGGDSGVILPSAGEQESRSSAP